MSCMVDHKTVADMLINNNKLNAEQYITVVRYFRQTSKYWDKNTQDYLEAKHVFGCRTSSNDDIIQKVKIISDELAAKLPLSKE